MTMLAVLTNTLPNALIALAVLLTVAGVLLAVATFGGQDDRA